MKNTTAYYFHLRAANHCTILQSEGYTTLRACINGMIFAFENAKDSRKFIILRAKNFRAFFILKAANGRTIGTSKTYNCIQGCRKSINTLIKKAQTQGLLFSYSQLKKPNTIKRKHPIIP